MSEDDNAPAWRGGNGTYEVWFLTLTDPSTGRGYWIRSSILAPRKGNVTAGVWFTRCDRADPAQTFGLHRRFGLEDLAVADGTFDVRVGDAVMASGVAAGSIEGDGHSVRWALAYPTGEETYRPLPDALIVAAAVEADALPLATFDRDMHRYGVATRLP